MNTNIIGRRAARALAVVLLASGAAIGLAACQTATAPAAPAPVERTDPRPFDRTLIEKYGGRPVDRVAEEIERAVETGSCRRRAASATTSSSTPTADTTSCACRRASEPCAGRQRPSSAHVSICSSPGK